MNLKSFGIGNFKAFGPTVQKVPIRPITLVFGPNSSGKSSLLHSLLWMNHAINRDELDVRYPQAGEGKVDLGGFKQTVNDQASPEKIIVQMELGKEVFPEALCKSLTVEKSVKVEIAYGYRTDVVRPRILAALDLDISIDDQMFLKAVIQNSKLEVIDIEDGHFLDSEEIKEERTPEQEEAAGKALEEIIKVIEENRDGITKAGAQLISQSIRCSSLPDAKFSGGLWMPNAFEIVETSRGLDYREKIRKAKLIDQLVQLMYDAAKYSFQRLNYIPPLRDLPHRHFDATDGNKEWSGLIASPHLLDKINKWLSGDKFQTKYKIKVSEFISKSALENDLPQLLREQVVKTLTPDACTGHDVPIAEGLSLVLDDLRYEYEELDSEAVIALFPHWKDVLLDWAAMERLRRMRKHWATLDKPESASKEWNESIESSRRQSEADIDYEKEIGWEALESRDAFAVEVFSQWAAMQPDVAEIFDRSELGNPDDLSKGFLSRIVSDSREVRREIHLVDKAKGVTVSLQDVGVGVSQVLPIIISAFSLNKEMIAIEQPEIHIHPALQAELGDLFMESALGENKNTFLLETHSEHLMLRLLRRIRETTEEGMGDWPESLREACPNGIKPQDVCVMYAEPGAEGTTLKELRINELGEFIDEWPSGFFDERIKEIL